MAKEAQNLTSMAVFERLSMVPASPAAPPPASNTQISAKTLLQVYCQKRREMLPLYRIFQEGPPHSVRFKSIVTVDGQTFESPQFSSTIKEAETAAAKVALMSLPQEAILHVQSTVGQRFIDTQFPAKTQLHIYCQKQCKMLPSYHIVKEGLPHSVRFKSIVTVDGRTFESLLSHTIKEAETAAAEVALMSLPQVQSTVPFKSYKNLLQEFTHKKGFPLPSYHTTSSASKHAVLFKSTVEVQGSIFQGEPGSTKKQVEMNAAEVAFQHFKDNLHSEIIHGGGGCGGGAMHWMVPAMNYPHTGKSEMAENAAGQGKQGTEDSQAVQSPEQQNTEQLPEVLLVVGAEQPVLNLQMPVADQPEDQNATTEETVAAMDVSDDALVVEITREEAMAFKKKGVSDDAPVVEITMEEAMALKKKGVSDDAPVVEMTREEAMACKKKGQKKRRSKMAPPSENLNNDDDAPEVEVTREEAMASKGRKKPRSKMTREELNGVSCRRSNRKNKGLLPSPHWLFRL